MTQTSDLELFTNRAMLIWAADMSYSERKLAFEKLLISFRQKVKIELMDQSLEEANEETFVKLRMVEGQ
jgi:hypothetical protein